ncbi:bacterial regulatory s, tetR family protein [Mycobacterium xenopi 3993]|nr:bacterial regulatory s, tetR family protein [Mycobacterium xenopi 3993]
MKVHFGDYADLPVEEAVRAARANSRRRQVLDAAVKVMSKTGFHQMSMQDLASEANVSVGLIYKYFGGKEDLLLATIVRIQEAFRDQLAPVMEAAGENPVEQLAAGIRRYIEIVDENLDAVVLTYRESRTLDAAAAPRSRNSKSPPPPAALCDRGRHRRRRIPRRRRRPDGVRHHVACARMGVETLAFRADLQPRLLHPPTDSPCARRAGR